MRLSNCASHNLQAGNRAAFVSLLRLINQAPIGRGRSPLMVVPAAQVEAPSTTEGSPAKAARFVGTGAKPAAEYHEADFVWQEHAAEVGPAVERQKEETLKARRESHQSASTSQAQTQKETKSLDENEWEVFYRLHPAAKFFKERRYLLLEFPLLRTCAHVVEIGAGCGSSILPVLKANDTSRATLTDVSATCLTQLLQAAEQESIATERLSTFVCDSTDPAAGHYFARLDADTCLIMFTLSAVPPAQQAVMLKHAFDCLAPGGRLCIRDHGLYDMVQLRIPPTQWIEGNLYLRGDNTHAYFYTVEDLSEKARAAGFQVEECKYVCVINKNRKSGLELRRVFIHGVFCRPAL